MRQIFSSVHFGFKSIRAWVEIHFGYFLSECVLCCICWVIRYRPILRRLIKASFYVQVYMISTLTSPAENNNNRMGTSWKNHESYKGSQKLATICSHAEAPDPNSQPRPTTATPPPDGGPQGPGLGSGLLVEPQCSEAAPPPGTRLQEPPYYQHYHHKHLKIHQIQNHHRKQTLHHKQLIYNLSLIHIWRCRRRG